MALANEFVGSDWNGSQPEVRANFNSTKPWYYDTDGDPGGAQVDFVTVALHELCHGLGFLGTMTVDSDIGSWGLGATPAYPGVYDRFTENTSGTPLLSYPNFSAELASQLTSQDVFFDGTYAKAGNGGSPPELYAPATWDPGSSYAHLDESYNGTVNDLMTYSLSAGQAVHDPGPVALGILRDTGWQARMFDHGVYVPLMLSSNSLSAVGAKGPTQGLEGDSLGGWIVSARHRLPAYGAYY
jgi:hypothetical protein